MTFKAQQFTLKSGIPIEIRIAHIGDAEDLLRLKRSYIKNTTSLPLTLEEYPHDVEKEAQVIRQYRESRNSILLVATHGDELVGNIDLTGSPRSKTFHTCILGMGIHELWRNQGLGGFLIQSALDWAKDHSPIELVCLEAYATNKGGIHLYQKCGFVQGGLIPHFFKDENGYDDKVQMYQQIK